jgi:hypothetical protein
MKRFWPAIAATLILASASAPAALGAEFPKSGQAEFDTYGTWRDLSIMSTSLCKQGMDEGHGIMRNVNGEGPFNDIVAHCLEVWTATHSSPTSTGTCALVDTDGDAALTTWSSDTHTFSFIGGTGKYQGITGGGSYKARPLHDAVGGQGAFVVRHQVRWEIK